MERVNGKHTGYKSTPPEHARHRTENQEKEKDGDRMNEEISQMMPTGIQAIKMAVELS
jgi:hypothetical protein